MNLEKLEKMANLVLDELSSYSWDLVISDSRKLEPKIRNLLNVAQKQLPEHELLFTTAYHEIAKDYSHFNVGDARSIIKHILAILEIEKATKTKIEEMKIFESAEGKMKQVNLSFRKEDYNSCFNNLNTALELVLKEKLRIPLTITKVNTAKMVDILVKHKIEPYLYLSEAKKHITDIANKIKHSGYIPSKSDCIFAINAMEELVAQLKATKMEVSEEVRNKIYEGL